MPVPVNNIMASWCPRIIRVEKPVTMEMGYKCTCACMDMWKFTFLAAESSSIGFKNVTAPVEQD